MTSCNVTPYQWCLYWLLGLSEDLREGLKINKGPLLGYIDSLHLWLPVGLHSIQFRPPYKVGIVQRFLTLCSIAHPHRWIMGCLCVDFNENYVINSLWPSDATWDHRSGSTLAQVMACCLTAPRHTTNVDFSSVRFCVIHLRTISQSAQGNILSNEIENYTSKITARYTRGQWVKKFDCAVHVYLQSTCFLQCSS